MPATLPDLVGDSGLDQICKAMADRHLLHLEQGCALPPTEIFSFEQLEQLLLLDGIEDNLNVTVNGQAINLDAFGVGQNGRLRHLGLRKLVRQGASLVLTNLQRHDRTLWALACDAEARIRERVRVSAVATFGRIPALKAHYDQADLIVIQAEGAKTWHFHGEPFDCAVPKHPGIAVPAERSASVTMRPGDVMFVPTGLHHQCECEGGSLHFVLWIEHATLRDVVDELFERHASLMRPLRAGIASTKLPDQLAALAEELTDRLSAFDPDAWLGRRNGHRARVTSLGLREALTAPGDEAEASLAVTMVPGAAAGERINVAGIGLEATEAALAVMQILSAGPVPVAEVVRAIAPQVGEEAARAALDDLVGKGIVRHDPRQATPQPTLG